MARRSGIPVAGLVLAFLFAASAQAKIIFVDDSNTSGTQDGTEAHPYVSIRSAITKALANDDVSVAPGTYLEWILMKSGIDVACQTPPTCIINATGTGRSAVIFDNLAIGPRLEGFTITGGSGFLLGETGGGAPIRSGGGIYVSRTAAQIIGNVIEGNTLTEGAVRGGGIAISGRNQTPQIIGNVIRDNVALSTTNPSDSLGGGIYISIRESAVVISDNTIESNQSYEGGGIYWQNISEATVSILRNIVQGNVARRGAGIHVRDVGGNTTIASNIIVGNGTQEGTIDCDDGSSARSPSQPEICGDGIDNDCNGVTPDVFDGDGDGFPCGPDCNDQNAAVKPGALEVCSDGLDNNCDGLTDAQDAVACGCPDADADGYRCADCLDSNPLVNPGRPELCNDGLNNDCNAGTPDVVDADADGYNCALDCNDTNPAVRPGATEVHCDGLDNDCATGTPDVVDADLDLWLCTLDCNDHNITINPDQVELCNDGLDNNCDGATDGVDAECLCAEPVDADGDSWRCLDCDDSQFLVNPGRSELCNDGLNNDCDTETPDIYDGDGDGALCTVDCQDFDPLIRPSAAEKCNDGVDNDCDSFTDLADTDCSCADADLDGFRCADCNDANGQIYPGRSEICNNGLNDDCNGATPDLSDLDADGVNCLTDCDDTNPAVKPSAAENCADRIDNDCDGLIDVPYPQEILVDFGSSTTYLGNTSDPGIGMTWTSFGFNDSTWLNGLYGVGFELGGGGVNDLVASEVPNGSSSAYTRSRFDVVDPAGVNELKLGADWDDGYVVWLNGVEIYRSPQMPGGALAWNTNPVQHESSNGQVPNFGTLINVSGAAIPALRKGMNILAVGVWNSGGATSSDLVIVPRLTMQYGDLDADCTCPDQDGDNYRCDDCNDQAQLISPGATEVGCNTINDDCNAATSDIRDQDGDGFLCNNDCNDFSVAIHSGAPEVPCDGVDNDCSSSTVDSRDVDGDGFTCTLDCDETSTAINPDAPEIPCDGVDNDCNQATSDLQDADFDGFLCNQECNDANTAIRPDAIEKCNDGVDNNCDGFTDAAETAQCSCPDVDLDGYRCADCNDGNAAVHPDRDEVCANAIDDDCSAATADVGDLDGDLVGCQTDCDDTNPFIRPTAVEICGDSVNNDCNAATPDIFDGDGDGHLCTVDCRDDLSYVHLGLPEICADGLDNDCNSNTIDLFDNDLDLSTCAFDCNDASAAVHPGAAEVCNNAINDDCDATTPDVFDGDGDGFLCNADCNDGNAAIRPNAAEKCTDVIDNDCDGLTDAADPDCQVCPDADADGFRCDDCNDASAAVNPSVAEVCNNAINDDCNAATPDIADKDGDGSLCTVDCNDNNPAIRPGAVEVGCDGQDNDCNAGTPDVRDTDGDGVNCLTDCNDTNAAIKPGAVEAGCDGIDNDCNASTVDQADGDADGVPCTDPSIQGGGVFAFSFGPAQFKIVNNTFVANSLPKGSGAAMYVDDLGSSVSFHGIVGNNIVSGNTARVGAIDHTLFVGTIQRNDLFSNTGGNLYSGDGTGGTVTNNLFVDPRFSNPPSGNYRLLVGSPLIDQGEPSLAPLTDVDAVPRPVDGNGDLIAVADLGAHEFPSGEVSNLRFLTKTTVSWTVAPGEYFNLYRGSLARFKSLGQYTQNPSFANVEQFCLILSSALPAADTFTPVAGEVLIYLVTKTDVRQTYEGSLGQTSSGLLRFNHFPCD